MCVRVVVVGGHTWSSVHTPPHPQRDPHTWSTSKGRAIHEQLMSCLLDAEGMSRRGTHDKEDEQG